MNGRLYDQNLGRFISADPFVQFPNSTQSYNRYTYVNNSPLVYTDPSGYLSKRDLASVVRIVGTVVSAVYCQAAYSACMAVVGAVAGYIEGGKQGALRGAAISYVGATVAGSIGGAYQSGTITFMEKAMLHGLSQGALSVAGGGRFGDGFLGGFSSSLASPLVDKVADGDLSGNGKALRTVTAAIIGGTTSKIGGGSFGNGAVTAAMVRAFNHERHPNEDARELRRKQIKDLSAAELLSLREQIVDLQASLATMSDQDLMSFAPEWSGSNGSALHAKRTLLALDASKMQLQVDFELAARAVNGAVEILGDVTIRGAINRMSRLLGSSYQRASIYGEAYQMITGQTREVFIVPNPAHLRTDIFIKE